jgi:hypothetical protein
MRSLSTRAAGLLIFVLGLWGGLIPFVGPYFHYALGPDKAWTWTTGRLWLNILPAAAAVLGGLMLISAGWRPHARVGALLALAAGIWFVIGPDISHLWNAAGAQGVGHGGPRRQMVEMLGYHTALGVVITALAAYVLPRFPAVAPAAAADGAYAAGPGVGPGYRRHPVRDDALAAGAAGAGAAAVTHRHRAAEDERVGAREPMATGEPAAEREPTAAGAPMAAAGEPVAGAGPVSGTQSAGTDTTAMDRGQYAPAHTGRRRRGGLLSRLARH